MFYMIYILTAIFVDKSIISYNIISSEAMQIKCDSSQL